MNEAVAVETEIKIDDQDRFVPAQPTITTVLGDGTITKGTMDQPDGAGMSAIVAMISDPDADPAEISRLITAELSIIAKEMVLARNDPSSSNGWKLKAYSEAIKSLKELRASLLDTEVISKKDILNFDGEKFKFYFGAVLATFTQSMKEAGLMEEQRNSIWKHYRDLMTVKEDNLRTETQKIGGLKRK